MINFIFWKIFLVFINLLLFWCYPQIIYELIYIVLLLSYYPQAPI